MHVKPAAAKLVRRAAKKVNPKKSNPNKISASTKIKIENTNIGKILQSRFRSKTKTCPLVRTWPLAHEF
jgi:hypothetical protein